MTTLQFHERAADSWLLWNETVLSNSKHNYIGQNVNSRPQLPVVTTNPKAIAVEEANLVASPKCFLKYSKVCGWTFGTEPGGSSELEKFLPVLELFFLISWPTCLWGCYCTTKENFRWMLENSTYKRGNILIGAAKEQAEWCREVIFGSLRPRAPLQKYCFPAHHLFSRPFCQKKKSQQRTAKQHGVHPARGHTMESGPSRRSHVWEHQTRKHKDGKVKAFGANAGCLDADAACKQEGTVQNWRSAQQWDINRTPVGPNGTVAAYWHTDNCISFTESCVFMSPPREKQQGSEPSRERKLIQN